MKEEQHIEDWEERLENLTCINGALYFGSVENPCSGRETGECCRNEQTYEEALGQLKSFIRSEIEKAYQKGYGAGVSCQIPWEYLTDEEKSDIIKSINSTK